MEVKVFKVEAGQQVAIPPQVKAELGFHVYHLSRADAAVVARKLQQSPDQKFQLVVFDAQNNSVIVQCANEDCKQCEQMIKSLDQAPEKDTNRPPQSVGLQGIFDSPGRGSSATPPKPIGAQITIRVSEDFPLNKVLGVAQVLNKKKPKVELEYDHLKGQLSIKVLGDDLTFVELTALLDAAKETSRMPR